MNDTAFPDGFLFGTATSSYQIEGAVDEGGRRPSIWDTFCRTPGRITGGDRGDVATDHYHRFGEDVALMKNLGVGAYRFSLAWPRILPDGTGDVNLEGIAFYHRLLDALEEAGIEPWATLYHWDLPQTLQDAGGWADRRIADDFRAYAEVCFREFGHRVKNWITLNEPWVVAFMGHLYGAHAPGLTDPDITYRVIHHLNLAHGRAVRAFREGGYAGRIGTTLNLYTPRAATASGADGDAADRSRDRDCRLFLNPLFGREYPARHLEAVGRSLPVEPGDREEMAEPVDFLGVHYYSEGAVRAVPVSPDHPEGFDRAPTWQDTTEMGWDIVPSGLLRQLRWIREEFGDIPLYITENGAACPDRLEEGRVRDRDRIAYLRGHLGFCRRAVGEGINLKGYFLWSFIDNFEWAHGYGKRFGLVYCDYRTRERFPKDSFYYYRDVIAGNEPVV